MHENFVEDITYLDQNGLQMVKVTDWVIKKREINTDFIAIFYNSHRAWSHEGEAMLLIENSKSVNVSWLVQALHSFADLVEDKDDREKARQEIPQVIINSLEEQGKNERFIKSVNIFNKIQIAEAAQK